MNAKNTLVLVFMILLLCLPLSVQAASPAQTGSEASTVASYDGETWLITWSGTASGYSDITESSGIHTVTSHVLTMIGTGTARYDEENLWKTSQFHWSVTDDFDEDRTVPCVYGGQSRTRNHHTILDPERPPVGDFLHVTQFPYPAGSESIVIWFAESIAGPPFFTYQYTQRHEPCGDNPPLNSTYTRDTAPYATWFWHEPGNVEWSNQPRLACDSQFTICSVRHEYSTSGKTPMQVSVTIHARRLPDSPRVQQGLELREESVFLPGVPLSERVDGQLECDQAATCSATRIIQSPTGASKNEAIGPGPTGSYPKNLEIGDLPPGRTTIIAQADSPTAAPPDNKLAQVAAGLPGWAGNVAGIIARKVGDYASYTWEAKFPEPSIEKEFDIPTLVPFVGGKKAGVELPQSGLKTEAKSTGEVSLEGSVGGALKLGDGGIGIGFAGRGSGVLDVQGVRDVQGEVDVKVSGKVSAEDGLIKAIPPLRPIVTLIDQFSPAAARFLEDRAKASLEIEPSWTSTFQISDKTGKIDIDQATIAPAIAIKVKASLEMIKDMLAAAVSVGGEVKAVFPTPPLSLKEIGLNLVASIEGSAFHFGFAASAGFSCLFPPSTCTTSGGDRTSAQGNAPQWFLTDRSYLAAPDYAQWRGDFDARAIDATGPTDIELVANVYPQANPSLALASSRRLLTWSHDRTDAPALSAQELAWSVSNGVGQPWPQAAMATTDDQSDFNREIAALSALQAVAVWQRFDTATPGDMNVDPLDYLSHIQVAASVWNGSSWRTPQQLSLGGGLNSRPRVGAISGGALAVWIANADNQVIGDVVRPDTIYFARFATASTSWTTATVVLADVAGLMDLQLATNGSQAVLVYVQDLDGGFATIADRELLYMPWLGNGWGPALRLTNNSVVDEAPRLALDGAGAPLLVWTQEDKLKFLIGSWDVAQAADIVLPEAVGASDLRLVRAAGGRLALTWQQPNALDTRIGYAIYDPTLALWSAALTHTPPISGTVVGPTTMAASISSALENNRLLVAYQLATVGPVTVTVGDLVTPNAPNVVRHSLRYAEIPLELNLSVTADDITVTPLDVQPGQPVTVTARIRNVGQLPAPAVQVQLRRDMYPNLLAVADVGPLAGGASGLVTFSVTQPITEVSQLSVRIAPQTSIYESTIADNEAPVITPPLVTALSTRYTALGPLVGAAFRQQGVIQGGHGFTVSLRLDDARGPEVGMATVAYSDEVVQQVVTATAMLSPTQLGLGRHLIYWVVEQRYADPADTDGAAAVSGASVSADLDLTDATLASANQRSGATTVSLLVANRGAWVSAPTIIAAYDRNPTLSGAVKLGELSVPALSPGVIVHVEGELSSGPAAVYLELDPKLEGQEMNRANNLIVVGQIAPASLEHSVFLPQVAR